MRMPTLRGRKGKEPTQSGKESYFFPTLGSVCLPRTHTQYLSHLGVSILTLAYFYGRGISKIDPGIFDPVHGRHLKHPVAHWGSQGLRGTAVLAWVTGVPVQRQRVCTSFLLFSIAPFWGLRADPSMWEDSLICPHVDLCAEVEGCLRELQNSLSPLSLQLPLTLQLCHGTTSCTPKSRGVGVSREPQVSCLLSSFF